MIFILGLMNIKKKNKKSNINLQKVFNKYGIDKFNWVIYDYFSLETKIISNKGLTDLDIRAFYFSTLYNFKSEATSMLNYKHKDEAKKKKIEHYKDNNYHPMYGKSLSKEILKLINKPGPI